MRCLVTGGCGFIGHELVEHILKNTDWDIVVLDKMNYASSGFDRLRDIQCFNIDRVLIIGADFAKPLSEGVMQEIGDVDYIVHMGAETHVDHSIENAEPFVTSNVLGTMYMLEFARKQKNLKLFVQFSTDEVYGPAPEGVNFKETDAYNSTNPYSATKAGAEQLALAYANTYKVPVIVTNTMNAYGPRCSPVKFIPSTMRKVWLGEEVIIHANKNLTKAGSRFYIHSRNISAAVLFLLDKGKFREKYNIVGEIEKDNLEIAQTIADIMGKPLKYRLVDFHSARPGHDLRYGLDGKKLKSMRFEFPKTFEESFRDNVLWHFRKENMRWIGL
jgi:dTDP-glucose 4,6-dehydratase